MGEMSIVERLPEELLVNIFSYLPFKDLNNVRTGCKHFQNLISAKPKWMKNPRPVSMTISAKLDSNGKRALEVICGDPEEHRILCKDTEIVAGDPFYLEWKEQKERILERPTYKKKYEKHLLCLESFSKIHFDGRPFGSENPLPSTSTESSFQEALLFFLRRFNLNLFAIDEIERNFTSEELSIVLSVIKDTGATVPWVRRTTETIDEAYMGIIQELQCNELMFCGSCDDQKTRDTGEYSVNNRILQVPCEQFYFYEDAIITVPTMLKLLEQWKDGDRQIKNYTYHHDQEGIDWFPLVKNDFNVVSDPEDIIWTCNATIELKTFTVARDIDDMELEFFYYGTYLEIRGNRKYVPPPDTEEPKASTCDDGEDDLGFGLFD